MLFFGGLDIGGTKCASVLGGWESGRITVLGREAFPTPASPFEAIDRMTDGLRALCARQSLDPASLCAVGVSCGGPLSSREGLILSPPNLPGWDRIPVCTRVSEQLGVPCALQNDANACALAEWHFGAGVGTRNMVFLTFGTGMGAGLILDGHLYAGTSDMAGEVGHVRLFPTGPVGYGKAGSFEGFCSGGGFAQLARIRALEAIQRGAPFAFCKTPDALASLSAKSVAEAADAGDADALAIYRECGEWLGRGLAMIVDILNPEVIVIGSVYARSENLLAAAARRVLDAEALSYASSVCRVLPAALGNSIGDIAALSVACDFYFSEKKPS